MRKFAVRALAALSLTFSVHAQGVKWHPGHYAQLAPGESMATHFARIDQIGKESSIQGVVLKIYWADIEKSKGVYDFSKIDAYLKRLAAQPRPKRLIVKILERNFSKSKHGIVPSYLRTEKSFHGGIVATRNGYAARLWEKPVMDRLITLYKVVGARYDTRSNFEGLATAETTLGIVKPYPAGYSVSALAAQWKRLAQNVRPAMPHTNLFVSTNWLGSTTLLGGVIESIAGARAGVASPDVIPTTISTGQAVWMGMYGPDYRGRVPIATSVETAELGGSKGTWTPAQLHKFAYQTLGANYMFWTWNTWMGGRQQQWSTGILPFLRTNPPLRTKCPRVYSRCN